MGALAKRELLAVALGVCHVSNPATVDESRGAWAKRLARAATPVIDVMTTGTRWQLCVWFAFVPSKVGNLVLGETGGSRGVNQAIVHRTRERLIDIKFAGLKLLVQRGVLLVDDLVAGEVFAAECDGFVHGRLPRLHCLAGNGEHEVDVDVFEPRYAQPVERLEHHFARVDAAKANEQICIERLHAHRNAVHTVLSKQAGLVRGHSGRVTLNRPFAGAEQVEPLHRRENALPLLKTEDRGSAAAEENRSRFQGRGDQLHLTNERIDVAVHLFPTGCLGVKGTVLAFRGAERHVHVKALNRVGGSCVDGGHGNGTP